MKFQNVFISLGSARQLSAGWQPIPRLERQKERSAPKSCPLTSTHALIPMLTHHLHRRVNFKWQALAGHEDQSSIISKAKKKDEKEGEREGGTKGARKRASQLEFNPQDPYGGRKGLLKVVLHLPPVHQGTHINKHVGTDRRTIQISMILLKMTRAEPSERLRGTEHQDHPNKGKQTVNQSDSRQAACETAGLSTALCRQGT